MNTISGPSRFLTPKEQNYFIEKLKYKEKFAKHFWFLVLIFIGLNLFFSFALIFPLISGNWDATGTFGFFALLFVFIFYMVVFIPIQIILIKDNFYSPYMMYLDIRSPLFLRSGQVRLSSGLEGLYYRNLVPFYLDEEKYFSINPLNPEDDGKEKVIEFSPRTKIVWRLIPKEDYEKNPKTSLLKKRKPPKSYFDY